MKMRICLLSLLVVFGVASVHADPKTEKEVRDTIMQNNSYVKENLRDPEGTIAKDGSAEFWSSGGLMQFVPADAPPDEYVFMRNNIKHIEVITLVPGKAAVAHLYSEGSFHVKGQEPVRNYLTRATQVFVKEDGAWKTRAAHWSPIVGGTGTNQTALD